MSTEEDWKRLGAAVLNRRVELGMKTREEFASQVDLSYRALTDLENGKRGFSASTYALIEQALLWRAGSAADVLAGGIPDPVDLAPESIRDNVDALRRTQRLASHPGPDSPVPHPEVIAKRLAAAAKARRKQLRLTLEDVAAHGRIPVETLERLERGAMKRIGGELYRRLDEGLRWTRGSAMAVAFGGDPEPLEDVPAEEREPRPLAERQLFQQLTYLAAEITSLTTSLNLLAKVHSDVLPVADQSDELARRAVKWALAWAREGEDDKLADALFERIRRWAEAQKVPPTREVAKAMHPSRGRVRAELVETPAEHRAQADEMAGLLSRAREIADFGVLARTLSGQATSLVAFVVIKPTQPVVPDDLPSGLTWEDVPQPGGMRSASNVENMLRAMVRHGELPMNVVETDAIPRDPEGLVNIAELSQVGALQTQ